MCSLPCLFLFHVRIGFLHALIHLFLCIANQNFQTRDASLSGLIRLSVLSVHGAEPDKNQHGLRQHHLRLSSGTEALDKVKILSFIHHIYNFIRMKIIHSLLDGSQIRRGVQSGAVRFEQHAGRDFLLVRLLRNIHYQCPLRLLGISALFHVFDHRCNNIVDRGFSPPEIEIHIQQIIIAFDIRHRDVDDVMPEGTQTSFSILQLSGIFHGFRPVCFIFLGFRRSCRVDFFQLRNGKGRFLRVFPCVRRIKVGQVRLSPF